MYKKTITTDACFFSLLIGSIKRKRVVGMRAVCVVSNNVFSVNINNEIALLATNKLLHLPDVHWFDVIEAELPSQYEPGITQIELRRSYFTTNVRGTITVNNNNTTELLINYDRKRCY